MKKRRSLSAALLTLLALVAPGSAPAASIRWKVVRELSATGTGLWYAVRVSLPKGSAWGDGNVSVTGTGEGAMGCGNILAVRNDAEGTYGISGGFGINYGRDYHVVRVAPSSLTAGPLTVPTVPVSDTTVLQDGDHGSPPFQSTSSYMEGYSTVPVDKPQVLDIAMFVACSGPISKSSLGFRVSDNAKVLAESWGRGGTRFLREWDFQKAAVYEATQDGEAEPVPYSLQTQTIAHGLRTLRFRKHAVVWMGTIGVAAGGTLVPAPTLLSVKGPWQPARMWWSSGDWGASIWQMQLPGTGTGTYTFGVEASAAAKFWPTGQSPFLFLVSADADYPACSVLRVRSKASDGHPLCY